ncbi:MAG: thermonuclease family protein [Verrucomicrobiales bacterium]
MKEKNSNVTKMKRPRKARMRRSLGQVRYLKQPAIGIAALAALLLWFTPKTIETVEFRADNIRVIDADTIAIGSSAIRLLGINAPELGEPLHDDGKRFLGRLLRASDKVSCNLIDERTYTRRVGRCFFIDGESNSTDIQRAVIAEGYATPYFQHGGWRYIPAMIFG